jgi:hypothetical protein
MNLLKAEYYFFTPITSQIGPQINKSEVACGTVTPFIQAEYKTYLIPCHLFLNIL